jgi:acyl-coenzyme A synthetase/AMP-(fatty) acid ligase
MLVIDMIFFWARAVPQRTAIVQPDMVMTYRELADAIESIGNRIEQLDFDKREPVAVSISIPAFQLATTFALIRAGYTVAFASPPLLPHLRSVGVRNVIYDLQGQVASGGRNVRFEQSWLSAVNSSATPSRYGRGRAPDVNLIFFRSGTTRPPKKIVYPAAALDERLKYPFTAAFGTHEKVLIAPSLADAFGINSACEVLNAGKTTYFAPDADAALSLINDFGIEFVIASRPNARALVQAKEKKPHCHVGSLKGIMIGGGRIGRDGISAVRAALCGNVLGVYGSALAGVIAAAPFDAIAGTPDAIGFVMPWVELEIVDELGAVLGTDAEGLVRYRTPQLTENLKATEPDEPINVRDGWFYPGHIGRLTADGILCLSGRSSGAISRDSHKFSSKTNSLDHLFWTASVQARESAD